MTSPSTPFMNNTAPSRATAFAARLCAPFKSNARTKSALKYTPRRTRRGMSLLDSSMAILLGIVFIVGLIWGFQAVLNSYKTTNLRIQLVRAQTIIDQAHDYSGVYANQSLLVFLSDEGFPDKQLTRVAQGSYTFTSPFDTAITIQGNGARDFTMTIANLPQTGCQAAVNAFADSSSGLEGAVVGSTTLTLPVTAAALAAACDNTTNTVALTF